jgi:PAS domain S-box-containing protein
MRAIFSTHAVEDDPRKIRSTGESLCRPQAGPVSEAASWRRYACMLGFAALVLPVLFWTSRENYLLFHGIVELLGVAVAWGVFLLVWNARRFIAHDAFAFLGLALFSTGWLDLLHTLAYKGMGVLAAVHDANPATQLWIAARILAISGFLAFPLLIGRRLRLPLLAAGYGCATILAAVSILAWKVFPDCFVEGRGLTPFKRVAEYLICMALAVGLAFLWRRRDRFEPGVFRGLTGVFLVTIASELCFTLYSDVYGVLNFTGHILKLLSVYLLYRSLIQASLTLPYVTLFRELDQDHRDLRKVEAELRQSETRFRNLFDLHAAVKLLIDPETGAIVDANQEAVKYYGWSRDEMRGMRIQEINTLSPDEVAVEMQKAKEARRNYFEFRHRLADGSIRDVAVFSSNVAGMGKPMLHSIIHDITEHKKAETALRESEERFRSLVEQAPDGIFIQTRGRFAYVNAAMVRLLGATGPEQLVGELVESRIHPDFLAVARERMRQLNEQRLPQSPVDQMFVRPDGSPCDVSITGTPFEFMGEQGALVFVRDVSERKRLHEKLVQQLQLVQAILNVTPGFLVLKDRNSIYREVNPAFCRFLGKPRDAIIGKSDGELFPPDEAAAYRAGDVTVMETGVAESQDWLVTASEEKRWLHVTKSAVRDENNTVTGVLCSVEDIMDRKRAEIALRENASMLAKSQEIGHIGSWQLELPSNRLTWSDEVYRIFGCQPQEFAASYQGFLGFVHPDDRAAVADAYAASLRDGSDAYEIEHRIVRPGTGEVRRVHERCIHERDEAGAIIRSNGMVQDITERKLVEDAQQFMVQCGLPVGGEDFFVSLARFLATVLSVDYVSIGRLLGTSAVESLATWDRGALAPNGCRELEGSPCGLAMGAGVYHCPAGARQAFPRHGPLEELGVESLYAVRLSDTHGEPIGFICLAGRSPMPDPVPAQLVLGVAAPRAAAELERRQQESVAEENHKRLISIIDAMPDPVYVSDPETYELLFVNNALRSILGEVSGRPCHEYLQGRDSPCPFCTNDKLFGANFSQPVEWEFQNLKNGRWYRLVDRGITWPDGRRVRFEIAMDLTVVKQAELALRESLMEKTALLKEVHHRVKNNLQVVASLLGLQARRLDDATARHVLQDSQSRVLSMALLHELLYRAGSLAHVDFDSYTERLCAALLRTVGPVAQRVRIERSVGGIRLPLEQAVPCGLMINELVTNALKHGYPDDRHGRVCIEMKVEDHRIRLGVSDDGAGLPDGLDINALPTLGLRLVQDLARQLQGAYRMERREGAEGGTAVSVVFPVNGWQDAGGST